MLKRILALLLLLAALAVALVLYRVWRDRPSPTVTNWKASVRTIAGDGSPRLIDSANAAEAGFADPFGIAIRSDGALYISDAGESNRIRTLSIDGAVATVAGSREGHADGRGPAASFNSPSALAIDDDDNLYVADTANNRVRKMTPEGEVTTLAGEGAAGYVDGPSGRARFDAPVGVAVDERRNVYVADTYNDRIRRISPSGDVTTIAGGVGPGYADGRGAAASFDTPCGIAVVKDGTLVVADTGNNQLRKISTDGEVTTFGLRAEDGTAFALSRPIGLAATHDGFLYVTELDRSAVTQIRPDGVARTVAGGGPGFRDGDDPNIVRLNHPTSVAVTRNGDLYVADSANHVIRKLVPQPVDPRTDLPMRSGALPALSPTTLGDAELVWPLEPQRSPHEVTATIGEVRGSYNSTDSRHHLHSGLDVFGGYGDKVQAIRSEKIASPLANWGFGDLNEGLRVGAISYIHIHVGRDKDARMLDDPRFVPVYGDDGKVGRIRLRRGTRFGVGETLGTVNRLYHVHLNVGPPGAEVNPLIFSPVGFVDTVAPQIERNGITLLDESGAPFVEREKGRLRIRGGVRIVVDAYDRNDMNPARRRLGVFRAGYQVLSPAGAAADGYERFQFNLEFDRIPSELEATKLAYAGESGITVYGSPATRFLYEITNVVRHGRAEPALWNTAALSAGDYILRVIVADYSGNQTTADLPVRIGH